MIATQPRIVIPTRCPTCGKWRARRTLRNPRRVFPRWGRSSRLVNLDGLQVGSDDAVRVSDDDKLIVAGSGDPCCCEEPAAPCSDCTSTHASIAVTLSLFDDIALQVPAGACAFAGVSDGVSPVSTSINISTTLAQIVGLPCVYFSTVAMNDRFHYNGLASPFFITPWYLGIVLSRAGTSWIASVGYVQNTGPAGNGFFGGGSTVVANCDDPFSITTSGETCTLAGAGQLDFTPL